MGAGNAYTPARADFVGDANTPANETADLVSLNMAAPARTNASYLLAIVPIHSATIMMGAIDRVRSVLTNKMQENIIYLCFIGTIESTQ